MTNTPKDKTIKDIADDILFPRETHSNMYVHLPWLNDARKKLESALAAEMQKLTIAEYQRESWKSSSTRWCEKVDEFKHKIASLEQELALLRKSEPAPCGHPDQFCYSPDGKGSSIRCYVCDNASLTAENERLRTEIAELRNDNECLQGLRDKEECYKQSEKYAFEAIGLRERIKALEGALQEIASSDPHSPGWRKQRAKEALASTQDGLTAEQVKIINNGFWELTADPQEKKEPAYDEAGGQASWATKPPPSEGKDDRLRKLPLREMAWNIPYPHTNDYDKIAEAVLPYLEDAYRKGQLEGDSAGPEFRAAVDKVMKDNDHILRDPRMDDDGGVRRAEQAVISTLRNMAYAHDAERMDLSESKDKHCEWCKICDLVRALDRAKAQDGRE